MVHAALTRGVLEVGHSCMNKFSKGAKFPSIGVVAVSQLPTVTDDRPDRQKDKTDNDVTLLRSRKPLKDHPSHSSDNIICSVWTITPHPCTCWLTHWSSQYSQNAPAFRVTKRHSFDFQLPVTIRSKVAENIDPVDFFGLTRYAPHWDGGPASIHEFKLSTTVHQWLGRPLNFFS